jgi:hypothetical protein
MKTQSRITKSLALVGLSLSLVVIAAVWRAGPVAAIGNENDLTGSWTWEGRTESAIPPFIVEAIGLIPEGEITYLTCKDSGEMELVQTGDTFEGTATQVLSCMTDGGQGPFWPPAFPPEFEVTNGDISGKYTTFNFGTCSFTAKVVGSGDKLMGEGACEIPLPPPYFLTLTNWKARR